MTLEKKTTVRIRKGHTPGEDEVVPQNFRQALLSAYWPNPCAVLPGPLWRYLDMIDQAETEFSCENGQVTFLKLQRGRRLMICWHKEQAYSVISDEKMEEIDFAVLHQRQIENFATTNFVHTPYFRMIHRQTNIPDFQKPAGFALRTTNPLDETGLIHGFLADCYSDDHPAPETILSWVNHPVFDPELWVLAIEKGQGKPVGLAVGEFDRENQEGAVLWVQVLTNHRGLGLGKWLTVELIQRLSSKARFTTVSGQKYNDTRPDILFHKVGFTGNDIWWTMRRKENLY
jgi:ribosomal protein S18 acetylase RimI-like enzyme